VIGTSSMGASGRLTSMRARPQTTAGMGIPAPMISLLDRRFEEYTGATPYKAGPRRVNDRPPAQEATAPMQLAHDTVARRRTPTDLDV